MSWRIEIRTDGLQFQVEHEPDRRCPGLAGFAVERWHTKNLERLRGLKFMPTLWVCDGSADLQKFAANGPGAMFTRP